MVQPYFIGIVGGSGSGKTFFLNALKMHFDSEQISLMSQDNYYQPRHTQAIDVNGVTNFDLPEAIDHEAFVKDLIRLKSGQSVTREEYTFNNPGLKPNQIIIQPAPVVIAEGLFVFHQSEVRDMMNMKIFIDASESTMLHRRIQRDAHERGYDVEDVRYRFENHVLPSYRKYILPFRDQCEVVIDNGGEKSTLDLVEVVSRIKKMMKIL